MVVTAERATEDRRHLPAATAVLSGDELQTRPATTLADAVQFLPGFQVISADGFTLTPASIARGFFGASEAEYVRVLSTVYPSTMWKRRELLEGKLLPYCEGKGLDRLKDLI